jgi:hypothetical protein
VLRDPVEGSLVDVVPDMAVASYSIAKFRRGFGRRRFISITSVF